jgi:hypothetical protein
MQKLGWSAVHCHVTGTLESAGVCEKFSHIALVPDMPLE